MLQFHIRKVFEHSWNTLYFSQPVEQNLSLLISYNWVNQQSNDNVHCLFVVVKV